MQLVPHTPLRRRLSSPDETVLIQAATILIANGFKARVRSVNLDASSCSYRLSVELAAGDARIFWCQGSVLTPWGFRYRTGEHGSNSVTLFSGPLESDVVHFTTRLLALASGQLPGPAEGFGRPHPEWDPYELDEESAREVNEMMVLLEEMFEQTLPTRRAFEPWGSEPANDIFADSRPIGSGRDDTLEAA